MLALTVGSVLLYLLAPVAVAGAVAYNLQTRGVGGCLRALGAVLWSAGEAWDAACAEYRETWTEAKEALRGGAA